MDKEQRSDLVVQQWNRLDQNQRSERTQNAAISNRARAILVRSDNATALLESLGFTVTPPDDLGGKIYSIAREQQRIAVESRKR